jgi:hypothetical protein
VCERLSKQKKWKAKAISKTLPREEGKRERKRKKKIGYRRKRQGRQVGEWWWWWEASGWGGRWQR